MSIKTRDIQTLKRHLDRWDMRLRVQHSLTWLPRGLLGGMAVGLLLALAARVWPLLPGEVIILLAGLLLVIGMVGALLGVWLWRRTPLQAARLFDRQFGLRERVSTALELAGGVLPVESETLAERQITQAVRVAGQVDARRGLPLWADWREWAGVLAALLILSLAVFLPNPQDDVLAAQAEVDQAIAEEIEKLEQMREEVLADPALTSEEQQAIVETLDEAIETLSQPGISQEEAVAALDTTQQELRDLSEQFAQERQQALEEASGLFDGTKAQEFAEALQNGDFAAAAEALENLDLDNLTPEEQQELAESLAEAAEALAESNPELAESLGEAAEALANGDTASAEAALDEAAGEVAEAGGSSTAEVDELADEAGKGEADVAQAGRGQASQPGQGEMGQAQPGQGGSSEEQGEGQGSSGAGRGEDEGADGGGTAGDPMETDNGPGDGGETPADDIYAPQRIGGEGGEDVDVPGDPGAGKPTGNEGDFANNPEGESTVNYWDVWADYERAINEALENGYIPLSLREIIRRYFLRLDPRPQ